MSSPNSQRVARISQELGIHLATLYNLRKIWRLQGEVVSSSEKEPEGWSAGGRQPAQDANAKPVLTMAEQKALEKLRAQGQREKTLRKE